MTAASLAATATPQELASALSPWGSVLQLCGAHCWMRRTSTGETVAMLHLDLARLAHHRTIGTLGRMRGAELSDEQRELARALREAMELVRLAAGIDACVLAALAEQHVIRPLVDWGHDVDAYDPSCDAGRVELSDVAFVLRYDRLATNTLRALVESCLVPRETMDGSAEFERARDRLRGVLRGHGEQLEGPLRISFTLAPREFAQPLLAKQNKTVEQFFTELAAAAMHVQEERRTTTTKTPTSPTSAALVEVTVEKFQVNFGGLQPTRILLLALQCLSTVPAGLIQCERVALGVCDMKCSQDELAEYLAIVLRHSPDAVVRVVQSSALNPLARSRRKAGWATETQNLFRALETCKPWIHAVEIEVTDRAAASEEDSVLFWRLFLETIVAPSAACDVPLTHITLDVGRHAADGDAIAVVRAASAAFQGAKRPVESLRVNNSRADIQDDIVEFMKLLVGPVTSLAFYTSYERHLHEATFSPILDLHPTLETLSVDCLALDSLDFIQERFGSSRPLASLTLRDVRLADSASVLAFFDRLRDPGFPLSRRLHTLRFRQQMHRTLALDDVMVGALDRLLRTNRVLSEISVVLRRDVSQASRELLLAHHQDRVIPPFDNRRQDVIERVAFMSVVESERKGARANAIRMLDAVQLRLIFGFCAKSWTRHVWLVDERRVAA